MVSRALTVIAVAVFCITPAWSASRTQVVLLGTPGPDPDHSGPATAIAIDDRAYLVDVGPGIVRRASAAAARGIQAVRPVNLKPAVVTHLHSDHTVGYLRRCATKSRTHHGVQPLRHSHSRGVRSSIPSAYARLAEISSAVPHVDIRVGRDCAARSAFPTSSI
jgi:ribonuclease BN (tRNA processing enzyme)